MKLTNFYNSLYYFLIERSLEAWEKDPQTTITTGRTYVDKRGKTRRTPNRRLEIGGMADLQYRAEFDAILGKLAVPVPSVEERGGWFDKPGYSPKEITPRSGGRMTSFSGTYEVQIQWDDWERTIAEYNIRAKTKRAVYPEETKKDLINRMLTKMDVKFNCTCPAFYWQGMQYQLTKINSAIYPVHTVSKKWIPLHQTEGGVRFPVCKHIKATLIDMKKNVNKYFYGKIYREFDKILKP